MMTVEPSALVFLAGVFVMFEVAQLVIAERFLGVKQIEAGEDPREKGPGETLSALWTGALLCEAAWMALLVAERDTRVHGGGLLLIWLVGYLLRSGCTLRWVLVILTIEGALKIGLMISLLGAAWRAL